MKSNECIPSAPPFANSALPEPGFAPIPFHLLRTRVRTTSIRSSPTQGSHGLSLPPRDPLKIRCSPPDSLTGISLKSSRGSSSPSQSYFPPLTVRGRGSSHRPWRSAATSPTWRFGQAVPADDRSCGKGAELGHLSLDPFFMVPVGWLVRCLPRGSGSGRRTSHPRSWHSFRRRRPLRLQRTACPRPPSTSSGRGSRRRSLWRPL